MKFIQETLWLDALEESSDYSSAIVSSFSSCLRFHRSSTLKDETHIIKEKFQSHINYHDELETCEYPAMLSKKNINLFPTNSSTAQKREIKKWLEFFHTVNTNKYFQQPTRPSSWFSRFL